MLKRILAGVVVVLTLTGCNETGPLEKGWAAYYRGDYEMAAELWLPLAEQGIADAQFQLGRMYFAGVGVPQDDAEAAKWHRLAAEQGFAKSQFALGRMHATGEGVPQDMVPAYMWFTLAAERGNRDAVRNRDRAARRMTPDQISEAQRLAREWKPKPER